MVFAIPLSRLQPTNHEPLAFQVRVVQCSLRLRVVFLRLFYSYPHFSPAFYCGNGSGHVYCVALCRAPRRTAEYVCGGLGRAPCIHARLRRLAMKPGEKCGLRPGQIFLIQARMLGFEADAFAADEQMFDLCVDLQDIAVGHHEIGYLSGFDGADSVGDSKDLCRT